jgi:3-hydroxyisobutyrate dehydrogenase
MEPRIAFLGLGIMGGGMARRLRAAGFPLAVYNRNQTKSAPLAATGAVVASSPRQAAKGAEVIISMVADDDASRGMWLGAEGALNGASRGAVMIECSTLTASWVSKLKDAVVAAGGELLDAPVTGSKQAAAAGELNFLVGGNEQTLERVRPIFMAMGKKIAHLGPTGSGALVKLLNNFMAGVHIAAYAEAVAWLERTGVDQAKAVAFLMAGAAASPVTKVVSARIAAEDYTPNFFLRLMAKDLRYAIAEAAGENVNLRTASAALERFLEAMSAGQADEDMAAVVKTVRAENRGS